MGGSSFLQSNVVDTTCMLSEIAHRTDTCEKVRLIGSTSRGGTGMEKWRAIVNGSNQWDVGLPAPVTSELNKTAAMGASSQR